MVDDTNAVLIVCCTLINIYLFILVVDPLLLITSLVHTSCKKIHFVFGRLFPKNARYAWIVLIGTSVCGTVK